MPLVVVAIPEEVCNALMVVLFLFSISVCFYLDLTSCESQLITIDDFAKALNSKKQVDILILDFSKLRQNVSCKT